MTDTNGTGLANIDVTAYSEEFSGGEALTNGEGKYTLTGVPPGSSYAVLFYPAFGLNFVPQYYEKGLSFSERTAVPVKEGATAPVSAKLQTGGAIAGTVTDATTHKPLANVYVYASNVRGFEFFGGEAITNANGEYTILGLASGSYNVEFYPEEPEGGTVHYITQTDNAVGVTQGSTTSGISPALVRTTPNNTGAPVASGTPAVGQTLSCSTGSWTGSATLTYAYKWLRDGSAIAGASGSTYVVQAADQGHGLACEVTATNPVGHVAATSNTLKVPVPVPPTPVIKLSTSKIVVSGSAAKVGIACSSAPCSGSIEVVEQVVVKHHKGKKTISHKETLVLAKGSYSLAAGHSGTFEIKLTATGKSTLAHAKHHRLSATLEASVSGGTTAKGGIALSEAAPKRTFKRK